MRLKIRCDGEILKKISFLGRSKQDPGSFCIVILGKVTTIELLITSNL